MHIGDQLLGSSRSLSLLVEGDILYVQDMFLTSGFHFFTVDDVGLGRDFIYTFLDSLNCFSAIGCLTLSELPLAVSIDDFYHDFVDGRVIDDCSLAWLLDEVLLKKFYYDFFWIEVTGALKSCLWMPYFEQRLIDFNISSSMPIIVLSYSC
jgi:hypothetical protein